VNRVQFFGAENSIAQIAKNSQVCLYRTAFLWFISFGGAKEMNTLSLKNKGSPFEAPSFYYAEKQN
jgi:hypothetical protein